MSILILTLSILLGASATEKTNSGRLKEALKEAPAATQSLSIQKTKSGYKYFVGPFGPCSCVSDQLYALCVKNLIAELKRTVREYRKNAQTICPPTMGCTQGMRHVYVDCPNGERDSLTNY